MEDNEQERLSIHHINNVADAPLERGKVLQPFSGIWGKIR